jgi:hypothetical protein
VSVATVGDGSLDVLVVTCVVVFEALLGDVRAGCPQMGARAFVVDPAAAAAGAFAIAVQIPAVSLPAGFVAGEDDEVVVVAVLEADVVAVGDDLDIGALLAGSLNAAIVGLEVEADDAVAVEVGLGFVVIVDGWILGDELLVIFGTHRRSPSEQLGQ